MKAPASNGNKQTSGNHGDQTPNHPCPKNRPGGGNERHTGTHLGGP